MRTKPLLFVLITIALLCLLIFQLVPGIGSNSLTQFIKQPQNKVISADSLDTFIESLLKKRQVPGLSLAVIQDGKIVKVKGYGYVDKNHSAPVTESTLFQAGSISKSVSAVGALLLVEKNTFSLDDDVNLKLRAWKVPENDFTKKERVTLRRILSHTAGLTVQGFRGYPADGPIPSTIQILDGATPANSQPVRVDFVPGTEWRYSGGGYTVMQQLILDVTGQSFPEFMQQTVLKPLGMDESTFEQPLPASKARLTATAHSSSRAVIEGRWHIYPEMAAAGLWTTPTDLARFAISIQNSFAGKPGSILSQSMARKMLTNQKNHDGLGVFLQGEGGSMRFGHGGRDEGFDAQMTASVAKGYAVVVMINANDNSRMMGQIIDAVAMHYQWDDFPVSKPINRVASKADPAQLAAFEGRYELENNFMITLMAENGRLFSLSDGIPDEELIPLSPTLFGSADRDISIAFDPDPTGKVTGFTLKAENEERKIPRIGPLFNNTKQIPDPNPARTQQIEAALKVLAVGGKAVAIPAIAAGTQRAFLQGSPGLNGIKQIQLVHSENVSGRGIQRHGSVITEIVAYQVGISNANRYVIVHLTGDGLVGDCDVVNK